MIFKNKNMKIDELPKKIQEKIKSEQKHIFTNSNLKDFGYRIDTKKGKTLKWVLIKHQQNYQKEYHFKNKERISKQGRLYYQSHKEETKKKNISYEIFHKEEIRERKRKYYLKNKERILNRCHKYYNSHKKEHSEIVKKYRKEHKKELKEKNDVWKKNNPDKLKSIKHRRRILGFIPLNKWFENSEAHHINENEIIYIQKELHQSIRHNVKTGKNMFEINMNAFEFLKEQKGIKI